MSSVSAGTARTPDLSLMLIAALVGVSAFLHVYSVQSILPVMMHDFQASAMQAGTAVGITVLAVALISPFVGMISDALGRRSLIVFSIFFLSVPTALIYFADTIQSVIVLRFFQGLVVPGIAVVMMAYIGEEFHGRGMARLMTAYIAGTILGGFLGRFLTGHLAEIFGWREAFLILAAVNLCTCVLIFFKLPPSRRFTPDRKIRHAFTVLGHHLHNRSLLASCAVGACILFSLVGTFTYINLHLAAEPYRLSSAALADIFAVYLLGVVITPVSARMITRFGARNTVTAALMISSCGLLLTLAHSLPAVVFALAVASCGIFITQAANVSSVAAAVDEGRSLATGLYNMSYYFGGFVGAWVCGYAYTHARWGGTVAVLAAVQMLGILIARVFLRKKVQAA